MNRLVLIDGNAILHRAYHALPPLTAPDGTLVNAVYGFTSMLLKIVSDLSPTHMAVAFDRPGPTFRKELFAAYQAKRPRMEDELVGQIEKVHEVVHAFGIPIYEADGYEADDVIGTIAKQAQGETKRFRDLDIKKKEAQSPDLQISKSPDFEVIIVTGDRDLFQLVDDAKGIKVFMPVKGLSEGKIFGEAEVKEKLGVEPKNIADYKALAGDASDNYPGIAGIGPKTGVELLEQFGSLENLLKAVKAHDSRFKKLPQSLQEKLVAGAKHTALSHELATVRTNVPIQCDFRQTRLAELDAPEARKILEELHFQSLLKRLSPTRKEKKNGKKKDAKEHPESPKGEQQQLL